MSFSLTDDEWALVERVPVVDLIDLGVALDLVIPPDRDRRGLVESCIPRLVGLARREGLPLSTYDLPDLQDMSERDRAALAGLFGLRPSASPKAILRAGRKAARAGEKSRGTPDPVAYMTPLLLGPVVRCALQADGGGTA